MGVNKKDREGYILEKSGEAGILLMMSVGDIRAQQQRGPSNSKYRLYRFGGINEGLVA